LHRHLDTYRSRHYVSCSPLSYCSCWFHVVIPPDARVDTKSFGKKNPSARSSSSQYIITLLASLTCQLQLFLTFFSLFHHPTPLFHLHELTFAQKTLHTANYPAQYRLTIILSKLFTHACVSISKNMHIREPITQKHALQ
jgi:hypothetical protein